MKQTDVFSTHTAAKLCRVTPMTIIRWIDEDRIKAFRTPGGHRRILREDLEAFCLQAGIPLDESFLGVRNRILVVDDEPIIVELLTETIRGVDESFEIDSASNGFDAGRLVSSFRPQLIFLDLRMPGVDGFQVCKAIKEDPSTAGTEIVIVTGHYTEENVARIRDYGASHVLRKPIDLALLRSIVREAFGMADADGVKPIRRKGKRTRKRKVLLVRAAGSQEPVEGGLEALRSAFDISQVTGGMDALVAVGRERPDLVVLDAAITDSDPVEICRSIRSNASESGIRIIAVHDDDDGAPYLEEAGADLLERRPVSLQALRDLLDR